MRDFSSCLEFDFDGCLKMNAINISAVNSLQEQQSLLTLSWQLSSTAITSICAFLAIVLYELWFRNSHAYKTLRSMPGPVVLPLIGNAHLIFGLSNSQVMRRALEYLQRYGETVRGVLGNKCIVFLTNPADIELILSSQVHLEKSEEYSYFQPWFGKGLLISKGEHWRRHRKIIAPTFHQSILKSFIPKFVEHSERVTKRLEAYAEDHSNAFDVHEHMSQITVEVLLSTVMGVRQLPSGKRCYEYAKAVMDMCHVIHRRQIELRYRLDALYRWTKMHALGEKLLRKILALTKDVIAARRRDFNIITDSIVERCEGNTPQTTAYQNVIPLGLRDDLDELDDQDNLVGAKQRLALLDTMVELTKQTECAWSEQDVIDEVNTIMFEGHDTTAAASSFVLCLLGIHQDIQTRVYAEQQMIFGSQMRRACSFNDTLEMHYLERVIKETLRLYPPVPVIARRVNEDVPLASGPYTIPRGCTVVLGHYAVQRRPDIYPNPNKFDPDNFLPEHMAKRHYYGYVPFSAGPRSCVGRKYAMLMLKVLLSTLLRQFQVHCDMHESDFKLQGDIILKLEQGFKIRLRRRP